MSSEITGSYTTVEFQLKINDFSKLDCKHKSDVFSVGKLKWRVKVYPKGDSRTYDHLSIYLVPEDKSQSAFAKFSFVVKSQTDKKKNETGPVLEHQFQEGSSGQGISKFIALTDLHDRANGYLKHNTCLIQVKVTCKTREAKRG